MQACKLNAKEKRSHQIGLSSPALLISGCFFRQGIPILCESLHLPRLRPSKPPSFMLRRQAEAEWSRKVIHLFPPELMFPLRLHLEEGGGGGGGPIIVAEPAKSDTTVCVLSSLNNECGLNIESTLSHPTPPFHHSISLTGRCPS